MASEPPSTRQLGFHQLHRGFRNAWWRSVLGIVVLVAVGVVLLQVILNTAISVAIALGGSDDVSGDYDRLLDLSDPTPFGLARLMLVLAGLIPVVFAVSWFLHRMRPGWRTSIAPRMRWGFFGICLVISVLALIATLMVGTLMPLDSQADGAVEITPSVNEFTSKSLQFLLVVLVLVPFQAAGEEYAFRGYLTQVFGGHFGAWVAILAPALLFALAHGAQDPPIFVDRFAFGLIAGILVVKTGGLEAAIAMHVLNNWLAFSMAIFFGDLGDALNPSGGTWWSLPVTLTQSLAYLGMVLFAARQLGLKTTVSEAELVASRGRV
ncbi:type II CAAX endopeptidase family protein [Nocardioides sp. AE5]|uniref:CPBP family intramembrane glutamic endopeptidase n=1 Tax=Nocardioides sp. AE5 TaxID=2962573 RepID=UPI00288173A2|nr:type II CAAX endopeptidase family protein [Nocardioides sp. AE5]MDT0202883.1 type II CAAX endopeptidase family protein [Nocardioides sp. AE5]